jgi:hypothetical protein
VIISVAMTKPGRELAWEFFQQNKDELRRRYEGGFLISRLVKVYVPLCLPYCSNISLK